MRSRHFGIPLALSLLAFSPAARGQISPGELSAAHAGLDGIGSCTSCHELGKALSNGKCLTCHTEIRDRINAGTGMHGPLGSRQCVECHKEHHGRGFSLTRFDVKGFHHSSVGFPLDGKHAALECASCHTLKFITSQDAATKRRSQNSRTYLGLTQECRSCHGDPHNGQLSKPCQQCHGSEGWKSLSRFSHDSARFRLTGKHALLQCARCHPGTGGDISSVRFTGVNFSACSSCHADPHGGKFRKPCESCHRTDGWKAGAAGTFNHGTTRFALRGKHGSLPCEKCHVPGGGAAGGTPIQRFAIAKFEHCADCHTDPHRTEFAGRKDKGACESCHTESGFSPSTFPHSSARFTLQGKHAKIPCSMCHQAAGESRRGSPPDFRVPEFQACADCHGDGHGGQFIGRADRGACESCHSVDGYIPPRYTAADHERSRFPLRGGHVAIPCVTCHPAGSVKAKSTRQFAWKEVPKCASCHRDVHTAQFPVSKYGGCASCHGEGTWQDVRFTHEATGFPLSGKHASVSCRKCHAPAGPDSKSAVLRYRGTPARCTDCHGGTSPASAKTQSRS